MPITGSKRVSWKVVAIIVITAATIVFVGFKLAGPKERAFSSEAWKAADDRIRGTMVQDLLKNQMGGLTNRNTIRMSLGKPDFESENEIRYRVDIGLKWGSSPWHYTLSIGLDADKVTEVRFLD